MKIWLINETYVDEHGRITEKIHKIAFLHREKASEYANNKIDELLDIYNALSRHRREDKEYYIVSKTLYSTTMRVRYNDLERLTLESIPVELEES